MEEDYERGGWIALAVGGVVGMLYGLVYLVWSLISAIFIGGLAGLSAIGSAMDTGDILSAIPGIVLALMPVIQLVIFVLVPILAAIVLFAALRYKSYRSKGVVWLGIVANVLVPLIGLLTSLGSCCNMGGCCSFVTGFILGNIPTIVVGVIALATSGYAAFTLMQEDVGAKFEANATE